MRVRFNNLIPDNGLLQELTSVYMRVMTSGQYIGGKEVEAFEQEWADYCEAEYCVSCGSGQSALELLLKAYDVGYGDKVIIPAWTAPATWKAVRNVGATLKLVDVDYDTMLINYENMAFKLVYNIEDFTEAKAVIPVHLYGYRVSDLDLLNKSGWVINDACQAHGLKNLGDAAWSFYPTKNLGAYGDGGAITTDDKAIADLVRLNRDSSRLDPLQAAFLRVKLARLDRYNEVRYNNAMTYELGLKNHSIKPPNYTFSYKDASHRWAIFHQYVIRSKERSRLRHHLAVCDIETMIHYPLPSTDGRYPNADRLSQEVLSLPITCSQEQVEYVCEAINSYYERE